MNKTELIMNIGMIIIVLTLIITNWFLYNEIVEERYEIKKLLYDAGEINKMARLKVSQQVLNNTLSDEPTRKATKTVGLYHTGYDIYCAYPLKNPFNFSTVDLHEHWHYMMDENKCFDLDGTPVDCKEHFCS